MVSKAQSKPKPALYVCHEPTMDKFKVKKEAAGQQKVALPSIPRQNHGTSPDVQGAIVWTRWNTAAKRELPQGQAGILGTH